MGGSVATAIIKQTIILDKVKMTSALLFLHG